MLMVTEWRSNDLFSPVLFAHVLNSPHLPRKLEWLFILRPSGAQQIMLYARQTVLNAYVENVFSASLWEWQTEGVRRAKLK